MNIVPIGNPVQRKNTFLDSKMIIRDVSMAVKIVTGTYIPLLYTLERANMGCAWVSLLRLYSHRGEKFTPEKLRFDYKNPFILSGCQLTLKAYI
jgi:hypothetical protein